jgi:hypothetical protein
LQAIWPKKQKSGKKLFLKQEFQLTKLAGLRLFGQNTSILSEKCSFISDNLINGGMAFLNKNGPLKPDRSLALSH